MKAGGWFGKMVKCQDAKTSTSNVGPVTGGDGKSGRVKFKSETEYYPFRMKDTLPVVKRAVAAVSDVGGTPAIRAGNGGLDANWLVRHRVPTVTVGTGQNEPHMIDEWINRDEYERAGAGGAAGDDG